MPDIISRVRFIGDSSQLLATYRTIGAQSQALQTQLNNAVRTNLRGVGLDPGTDLAQRFFNQKSGQWVTQYTRAFQSAGPIIKNLRAELDSVNKTFRVTGDTALIAGNGMEFLTGKYEGVLGNSDEVLRSAEKLNRIYAQTQPIRNQTRAIIENAKALRAQGQALRYSQFGLQAPAGRNAGSFATLSQIKAAKRSTEPPSPPRPRIRASRFASARPLSFLHPIQFGISSRKPIYWRRMKLTSDLGSSRSR